MKNDLVLVKIDKARYFLEKAKSLQEVKQVIALADAAKVYSKRVNASIETINYAAEIRLRAERRLGEILDKTPKNKGESGRFRRAGGTISEPPDTLASTGISKKTSSRAQQLFKISEPDFEAALKHNGELNPNRVVKDLVKKRQMDARQSKRNEASRGVNIHNQIFVGDFRDHDQVKDGSLSLIFTDPPYNREALKMFPDLADFATSKLADGGSIVFYLGQIQLPEALEIFCKQLRYWWTCACVYYGSKGLMREYGIKVGWKPLLWFVKGTRDDKETIVEDVFNGGREKSHHDWQQSQSEAEYWIEKLCPKDGIVCDPFLGSGTTAVAAQKLKRKWIGFEIDQATAAIASRRLL